MSLPLIIRAEAETDIQAACDELEGYQVGLGQRFVGRVREVFERIERTPELHGFVWQDVRATRVKRFRYVVYYVVFSNRIEVLAVLHGSRDPSVWQSRV